MNIGEAKIQIKNAMTAYFTRDELGNYVIPIEKQRPVFLMGPPGIGKTAIMEQIAQELGVGLISYSMIHHTRQSALGLPFITHKNYAGTEFDVSEYTMSEIIASVYDMMERNGVRQGILFLDEINCVSETLAPVMLQFLQYKVFGRHRVPDGWIVVTAGNPPEYNHSVRAFDVATWDRLKRIDVEPDYDVWKEYALNRGVHPAVLTYLEIKKNDFYSVESVAGEKEFVTARGWDDLSMMLKLYEQHDIPVDGKLIGQYIQKAKLARAFAVYYDLFRKYRSDYQVDSILNGKASPAIYERAKAAKFDERLTLLGLLLDALCSEITQTMETEAVVQEVLTHLKNAKVGLQGAKGVPADIIGKIKDTVRNQLSTGKASSSVSMEDQRKLIKTAAALEKMKTAVADETNGGKAFDTIRAEYNTMVKRLKSDATAAGKRMTNAFCFIEEALGDGQEMLVFVTELTLNKAAAMFISHYGCKEYFKHNKNLLLHERGVEITRELEKLNLDQ